MISGIVGLAGASLNDDPLGSSVFSLYQGIHVILTIVSLRKSSLAVLKGSTADISRWRIALTILNSLERLPGFQRDGISAQR